MHLNSQNSLPIRKNGSNEASIDLEGMARVSSAHIENEYPRIKIGVCAMDRKARSKPMREIINRMNAFDEFDILTFGDELILNKPPEQWPICDCLMSWHSEGFPLLKAQSYALLHRPYLINDVHMQDLLLDRRKVYKKLVENMIPVPHHIIVDREGLAEGENPKGFVETEDYVEIDGKRINKPFVEKPTSGEDHNIWIYYQHQQGGGVKKLFRKVGDRSADYIPDHPGHVRKDRSYIYEEFLPTGGTDVKVYTVGPRYAHAEARKSPVVDGKVLRTSDGKEMRFPVLLSPYEKDIARMVSLAFKQKVCGLDLLRADNNHVFVCDVNGWSFVKSSKKYYDDAAGILRTTILSALAPHRLVIAPTRMLLSSYHQLETLDQEPTDTSIPRDQSYTDLSPLESESGGLLTDENRHTDERSQQEELRCVLAIIRHGDRTPKQKMKMKVSHPLILKIFENYKNYKGSQATIKSPNELQELLDITKKILAEHNYLDQRTSSDQGVGDQRNRLRQLSITRYVSEDERELIEGLLVVKAVLEKGGGFSGINRKVQLKPLQWGHNAEGLPMINEVLLILKHGGTLTHSGRKQASDLGKVFRSVMYPRVGPQGGGLLRLHSTYRHDLKIYSSDEGRVQSSAAAFAKSFLDLEGSSLTPILVSLVKKDATLLDAFGKGVTEDIARAKEILYRKMTFDQATKQFLCSSIRAATPQPSPCGSPRRGDNHLITTSLDKGNQEKSSKETEETSWNVDVRMLPPQPLKLLHKLVDLMQKLVDTLQARQQELLNAEQDEDEDVGEKPTYSALTQEVDEWKLNTWYPCGGEEIMLVLDRWRKLLRTFWKARKNQFDISKIPDVYDSAKYDLLHNSHLRLNLDELFKVAKLLADAVIPNEYGITPRDKLNIGSKICAQLLGKLTQDLENMREESLQTSSVLGGDGLYDYCAAENEVENMAPFLEGCSNGQFDEGGYESEPIHRLAPYYADDINSPLRHVRTRIYFTSESHIHSLLNVLRYCQLDCEGEDTDGLLSPEGRALLDNVKEFDYLTQIVFRMYENKVVPVDEPDRFRLEILFSPGTNYNPLEAIPIKRDHVLPPMPRKALHKGSGVSLQLFRKLLDRYMVQYKQPPTVSSFAPSLAVSANSSISNLPPTL